MARNEEKAQQMLNKWVTMKAEFNAGNIVRIHGVVTWFSKKVRIKHPARRIAMVEEITLGSPKSTISLEGP